MVPESVNGIVSTPVSDSTVTDKAEEASAKERVKDIVDAPVFDSTAPAPKVNERTSVIESLNGIVGTPEFNKYVDASLACDKLNHDGKLKEEDAKSLEIVLYEWLDSIEKTPVNELVEWFNNFATKEQKRAVMFAKFTIEMQYNNLVQLVKRKPDNPHFSQMLKVEGNRLKSLGCYIGTEMILE